MWRRLIYPLFGLCILGMYGASCYAAWDPGAASSDARTMPAGARQPGGGFRAAPIFWYGGYSGGK